MRKIIGGALALTLLSSTFLIGQDANGAAKKASVKKPAEASVSTQLQELKEQFDQKLQDIQRNMQKEIDRLSQQLKESNQKLQSVDQKVEGTVQQSQIGQRDAAALHEIAIKKSTEVNAAADSNTKALALLSKEVKDLQNPAAIRFKGTTLTPYGWLDLGMVRRSRNLNSDMVTLYSAIPLDRSMNAGFSESRMSARQSRIGLRGEGMASSNIKLTGLWEIDFSGTTEVGANENQLNNFPPRIRSLWGQAEFLNSGVSVSVGQMFSLWTPNRKGIALNREWLLPGEEGGYAVGFQYARQAALRVTKNWNNKVAFAFAAENPSTTVSSAFTPSSILGIPSAANLTGGNAQEPIPCCAQVAGLPTLATGPTTNPMPDLIMKIAIDPGWGHYEIRAIGNALRDRVALQANGQPYNTPTVTGAIPAILAGHRDHTNFGGALGYFSIMPLTKTVDFIINAAGGAGNNRYNSAGNAGATINANYELVGIKNLSGMVGFETRPTPKLDVFTFVGEEYYARTSKVGYTDAWGNRLGFGNPLVTAAPSNNKDIWGFETGYWYRFYRGPFGAFATGFEYGYAGRSLWRTAAPADATTHLLPPMKGAAHIIDLSLRYVLPN